MTYTGTQWGKRQACSSRVYIIMIAFHRRTLNNDKEDAINGDKYNVIKTFAKSHHYDFSLKP
jgi:hypothetical protein